MNNIGTAPVQGATPTYIAVEGPIGVGKTTLASELAKSLGSRFIHDTELANPYLEAFYKTPDQAGFHTQMHFLASRLELLAKEGAGEPGSRVVTDFLLAKDRLFAELNLDETEWWMYQNLTERLLQAVPAPDLVIYLQAPLPTLIQRIKRRGLRFEQHMDSAYLQRVIDMYERFFHEYEASSVLIVNASEINIADNPSDLELLLNQIMSVKAGRNYFNPASTV